MEIEFLKIWDNSVLDRDDSLVIAPINTEIVSSMVTNPETKEVFKRTDVRTVDGRWLQIFLQIFCNINVDKISGSDVYSVILNSLNDKKNKNVLLAGGEEESNDMAIEKLKTKYENLKFFGIAPPFGESLENIVTQLNHSIKKYNIDFCIICFGFPKQEKIALKLRSQIESGLIFLCAGGTVDFISGKIKRAPKFVSKIGLEWLYRIREAPVSRSKRQLRALILFSLNIRNVKRMFLE